MRHDDRVESIMTRIPMSDCPLVLAVLWLTPWTAAGTFWINPAGGSYQDPANWNPQIVPTGSTFVEFNLNAAYHVQLSADGGFAGAGFFSGAVTFDLNGYKLQAWQSGRGFIVGDAANANASVTFAGGRVVADDFNVSDNGNTVVNRPTGALSVIGPGTRLEVNNEFKAGRTGIGTITVSQGGVVSVAQATVFSWEPGSTTVGSISGAGSSLETRDVYVGHQGWARVLLDDGAAMSTTRIVSIGAILGSDGQLVLRGNQSSWTHHREAANNKFIVGEAAPGVLAMLSGATISTDEPIQVNPSGTLYADGQIGGAVVNNGTIAPGGTYNDTTRRVADAIGQLTLTGTYTQKPNGLLEIQLGGPNPADSDRLTVQGAATLAGTLDVSFVSGFAPAVGTTFTVLAADSIINQFDCVRLPAPTPDHRLVVSYSTNAVTLEVIDAPCPADFNHDGFVNGDDFDQFSYFFYWADCAADVDGNGFVSGDDFDFFTAHFDAGC